MSIDIEAIRARRFQGYGQGSLWNRIEMMIKDIDDLLHEVGNHQHQDGLAARLVDLNAELLAENTRLARLARLAAERGEALEAARALMDEAQKGFDYMEERGYSSFRYVRCQIEGWYLTYDAARQEGKSE